MTQDQQAPRQDDGSAGKPVLPRTVADLLNKDSSLDAAHDAPQSYASIIMECAVQAISNLDHLCTKEYILLTSDLGQSDNALRSRNPTSSLSPNAEEVLREIE